MTTAWINGSIFTGTDTVEALLTKGEQIVTVGTTEEILATSPEQVVDLQGKCVLPGFNDSHLHLHNLGKSLFDLSLAGVTSIDSLISRAKTYLETYPERCEKVLRGRGWNQDYFEERRFPTREELDQISTDIPIAFVRVCGHVAVLNSKAFDVLGICADTPDPPGGVIEIKEGKLTGLLTETALDLLKPFHATLSEEDLREQFRSAFALAVQHGVTSAQSNDLYFPDALAKWKLLCDMEEKGEIPLRITEQLTLETPEDLDDFFAAAPQPASSLLRVGPIKLLKDGSLGARTALMLHDYADAPGERGTEALSDASIERVLEWTQAHGRRLIVHVIGDGALEQVLDLFEKAEDPSLLGLVHCQISSSKQLDRIAKIGCFVMAQPIFLDYDLKILEDRVGKELASTSYAFATLMRKGVSVSLGTDCPVEGLYPLPNLYCAIHRTDLHGKPEGGYHPEHAFTLEEAIRAYTVESARQEGQAESKGKLMPGYLADFVVLLHNPFEENSENLLKNRVVMTVVGGETVFSDQTLKGAFSHA